MPSYTSHRMLTIVVCFSCMVFTNCTNKRLLSYRWFLANSPQRNPQKVNSLVYKDYTLVEHEDGTKAYVSPQEKNRLFLHGQRSPPKLTLPAEEPALPVKDRASDSDSEYEVPVTPCPRHRPDHPSFPGEISPGDNGRINLPPYIVPLETSLTLPMAKRKSKERDSPKASFWQKTRSPAESPEDAEGREVTVGGGIQEGVGGGSVGLQEPEEASPRRDGGSDKHFRPFSYPELATEALSARKRRAGKKFDTNPLRKMFGARARCSSEEEVGGGGVSGRYRDAALSEVQSDTESADHGSADKSSVTKLTSEKQPKKLMSGLLGSFRKGKSKDKVADNDPARNHSSFEISLKEPSEDVEQSETVKAEGIVYAELDMARSPGSVMKRDDEKTEYAEIIYPGTKPTAEFQRAAEELRKSRENLAVSREKLTEIEETFSTTPDGKKEAAV